MAVKLSVNGTALNFDVEPDTPLLYVLRDNLALHGPKFVAASRVRPVAKGGIVMPSVEEYARISREERVARIERTAGELQELLATAGTASLSLRPAADAWAAIEVLCHLRDSEEWFLTRMQWALVMDEPAFPRNNPDRWAVERQYLRHDASAALAAFRRHRSDVIGLFRGLSDDQWARGGSHLDGRGRRSIEEFLNVIAWHDDNHLDQMTRALQGRP